MTETIENIPDLLTRAQRGDYAGQTVALLARTQRAATALFRAVDRTLSEGAALHLVTYGRTVPGNELLELRNGTTLRFVSVLAASGRKFDLLVLDPDARDLVHLPAVTALSGGRVAQLAGRF